jgi:hypothetical protein
MASELLAALRWDGALVLGAHAVLAPVYVLVGGAGLLVFALLIEHWHQHRFIL